MPTEYTSGLRLIDQGDGENANTWGELADLNFQFLDDAITRVQQIDLTGSSSYTLTVANGADDEARSAVLEITGIPTSANSVIIPSSEKLYAIRTEHTSVDGGITVRTNSGTGVTYFEGGKGWVYCNGVSVYDLTPETSALDPSENLGDLPNVSAAKVNLGLDGFVSVSSFSTDYFEEVSGELTLKVSALFEIMWPVGSMYSNRTDGTNPDTLMGFGTWVSAGVGRVPIGVGVGIDVNGVSAIISAETCGGLYQTSLSAGQNGPHDHFMFSNLNTPSGRGAISPTNYAVRRGDYGGNGGYEIGGLSTLPTVGLTSREGSAEPVSIMQPWYSVYQWVRTA